VVVAQGGQSRQHRVDLELGGDEGVQGFVVRGGGAAGVHGCSLGQRFTACPAAKAASRAERIPTPLPQPLSPCIARRQNPDQA